MTTSKTLALDRLGRHRLARYGRAIGALKMSAAQSEERWREIDTEHDKARAAMLAHLDAKGLEIAELREALAGLLAQVDGVARTMGWPDNAPRHFARKVLSK